MNKPDDKKTALKLINNNLEQENKTLKEEINNLKVNLKINKEIIEGFFIHTTKEEKNKIYIEKLKEEVTKLQSQLDKLTSDNKEMRNKLNILEQNSAEKFTKINEENEKYRNKIFVMDNSLIKKDNIIQGLKKRLNKLNENQYYDVIDRELYVIEPSIAVNQINDELFMYKEIYESLSIQNSENFNSIFRLEKTINELENENAKLKSKIQVLNKENDFLSENRRNIDTKNIPFAHIDIKKLKDKMNLNSNQYHSNHMISSSNVNRKFVESDEWNEILKYSGLTHEDLNKLSRNHTYSKYAEAFEMLNRLLCDKSHQIRLLEQENENLNEKNCSLNKDNAILFHQCLEYKKSLENSEKKLKKKKSKDFPDNSSMINNTSRITINNLNIMSLDNKSYAEKLLKNKLTPQTNKEKLSNMKESDIDNLNNDNFESYERSDTIEHMDRDINNETIKNVRDPSKEEGKYSKIDSVATTKDQTYFKEENNYKYSNSNNKDILYKNHRENMDVKFIATLDSCTSSEFKATLNAIEQSFISYGNNDINNLNIHIR